MINWQVIQGDCLNVMRGIPSASVDACITDPPYGTTACAWDSVIPFTPMWTELKRIVKPKGAIVLFASQPFTSALVMSNPAMFKYEWVWQKNRGSNFAVMEYQPMKEHESVLVFALPASIFNPQMEQRKGGGLERSQYAYTPSNTGRREGMGGLVLTHAEHNGTNPERFPSSVQKFNCETGLHPNQKPVELLRYLVRTYTNAGDSVLDFTCGSGTTGVACAIEDRDFVGIEQDAGYCEISRARISRATGIACDIPRPLRPERAMPLFEAVA